MRDLIDRQAAIDALEKVAGLFPYRVPGDRDSYGSYPEAWNDAIGRAEMEIEQLPSAQPEIIRCKDCKYWKLWEKKETWTNQRTTLWLPCLEIITDKNWFCGNAERRTDV